MGKTKKKAVAPSGKLPDLLVFVPCDLVSRDPNSGKATIYGIFDQFLVSTLPSPVQFSIYAKLSGGSGSHQLRMEVIGPDGQQVGGAIEPFSLDCNPGERYDIHVRLPEVEIERYGVHQIRLRSGEAVLGEPYLVEVVRRKNYPFRDQTSSNPSIVKSKGRLRQSDVERLMDDVRENEHLLVVEERQSASDSLLSAFVNQGPTFTLSTFAELCGQGSDEPKKLEHWQMLKQQLAKIAKKVPPEIDIDRPLADDERQRAVDDLQDVLYGNGPLLVVTTLATFCEQESDAPKYRQGQDLKVVRSHWKTLAARLRKIEDEFPRELDDYE